MARFLQSLDDPEISYSVAITTFWIIETVYQDSFAFCIEEGNKTPAELLGPVRDGAALSSSSTASLCSGSLIAAWRMRHMMLLLSRELKRPFLVCSSWRLDSGT
ncbi:hypothetical protein VPH35_073321 [Triticum aestivum]